MAKPKLLCVLHRSPPLHGAAAVGDFIAQSKKLQDVFDCKFITIKSSDTICDIGKISFKKLYFVIKLYIKIFISLLIFRPSKIYFTASTSGVAFYRDVLLSTLWKMYGIFKDTDIFYHYHTKGVDKFINNSTMKLKLTNFFLKDINIILLSPLLKKDLVRVSTYKKILFLPNGAKDTFSEKNFSFYLNKKFNTSIVDIHVLYLSNMIKSKGYFEVLKLAQNIKNNNIYFHFAGGWQNELDEREFFQYIQKNKLENKVKFHGFANEEQKKDLFRMSHLFIFPTQNESFGLVLIESLSHGIPIIATNEGSIPFIVDEKSGIIVNSLDEMNEKFNLAVNRLLNINTAKYCRNRYLQNFTLEKFESNIVQILK